MKNPLLSGLLCLFVFTSSATVRTVCNMPYSPGQYTSFNAAHTAALANDTLYVHGSNINYGGITISKPLVIIGAGHNPNKQVPLSTSFNSISLQSANIRLIGLTIETINTGAFSTSTTIKRCKITGNASNGGISATFGPTNWLIEGCVFISTLTNINFGASNTDNTIIRNNIFNGIITSNGTTTFPNSFIISNNVFLGTNPGTLINIYNATINNNIFYRSSPQGTQTGCAMNNNISYLCGNNNFSAPGTGNLVNVNPMFTSFPAAGALFDYSHNYNLAPGSPGIATGNDGTDRGVYGAFGYKFNMTGEPAMAEIITFNITSPTVIQPGGTLNISVTSKRIK